MKFEHKKSLGQNFLNSDYVPKKMCDAADLTPGDVVLEIGPGAGALTKELLKRDVSVVAVEADERAVALLQEVFASEINSGKLTVFHTDARELNVKELRLESQNYKVVSNIPYYLSGLLFRTLLESDHQPNTLVFLVQKEVAERIARDKKESLLSISVKVFGEPKYISTIKKGHFTPPPKIDSAIIGIYGISHEKLGDLSSGAFFSLLHLGFGQKRKQLVHNLSATYDRVVILQNLEELGLSSTVRAEDISAELWIQLAKKLL